MGKYFGAIAGVVIALLGIEGLVRWWPFFLAILKGSLPVIFILAGAIAVIAAFSEIKDELFSKKEKNK